MRGPNLLLSLTLLGTLTPALHAQGAVQTNTNANPMAADADPSFEVASIKLHDNNSPTRSISILNIQGQHYSARNVDLEDLVKFAYSLQSTQILKLPNFPNSPHYDINATMQPEGRPSGDQVRTMLRKLLAERFKLTFHAEQRALPVYTLTVTKAGLKAPTSDSKTVADTEHEIPGGMQFNLHGATSKNYANYLQQAIMDRPVVDHTGLPADTRYNFDLAFLPDDSMFGGRFHFPDQMDKAAPNIFTALQEQLGLKLTPEKISIDVLVIDHAEPPSDN